MESTCRISRYMRCYDSRFHSKSSLHNNFRLTTARKPFSFPFSCSFSSSSQTKNTISIHSSSDSPHSLQGNEHELLCEDLSPVKGGIVALGKFDALHIGHRELAVQASKHGIPYLLSFVGIAEVLGWEQRPPIVAKCDRQRVLSLWASYCGNVVPREFHLDFSNVRHLSPRQFVERLSKELKISGVVAGENYRFGYKASGDASDLVKLCKEFGLGAYVVTSVMDRKQSFSDGVSGRQDSKERGQVSSTRVRQALAAGDMTYVSELLGRNHRLVLAINEECLVTEKRISAPKSCMLNQQPRDGLYEKCILLIDEVIVGPCRTIIDETHICIELNYGDAQGQMPFQQCQFIGIEFGHMEAT